MKGTQLLYVFLMIAVFSLGYLLSKVQYLEQQGKQISGTQAQQTNPQPNQQAGAAQPPPAKVDVKNGHLPFLGNKDAKITIVEFSDFQCPFCRSFFEGAYKDLKKDYIDTGKAKLYFRHFPLASLHPMAQATALASECANEQDKFWEYHDKIFSEQQKKDPSGGTVQYIKDDLKQWASDLGLNRSQFNQCLDSEKYKNTVTTDISDGENVQVNGTPTFFINGNRLVGAQPIDGFKTILNTQ